MCMRLGFQYMANASLATFLQLPFTQELRHGLNSAQGLFVSPE